jgi:hypothetical protein
MRGDGRYTFPMRQKLQMKRTPTTVIEFKQAQPKGLPVSQLQRKGAVSFQ